MEIAAAGEALKKLDIESLLAPLLVQLAIIIPFARFCALIGRRFGQPFAVGEIVAGLLLGPSCLKRIAPTVWEFIFRPEIHGLPHELSDPMIGKSFALLSQIGLILLMFMVGLEFDFSHLKWHGPVALWVSLSGILFPFALGLAISVLLHPYLEPHDVHGPIPWLGFALFMGVAMSITAIPILGRIMMELNITRTRLGVITITAAAVDDAMGWTLLATVAGVVRSGFHISGTLWMIAQTIAFGVVMAYFIGPALRRMIRPMLSEGEISLTGFVILLTVMLASAFVTGHIGIFAIFGSFLFGAVLSPEPGLREAVNKKLRDVVTGFFLPIFFTSTGLRTDIGALTAPWQYLGAILVLAAAVIGKFGGCGLAARLGGFSRREAIIIGVMMNTRALMELIVINQGFELGVIPPSVFTMLVLMALITTIMTTPILLRVMRGTELEPYIESSGFLRRKTGVESTISKSMPV